MGSSSKGTRWGNQYIHDNPDKEVFPYDCVPTSRSKGSWTQGVKAWEKGDGSNADKCIGWFHPPRMRNKGHKSRYKRNLQKRGINLPQDVQEQLIHDAGYPEVQEEEQALDSKGMKHSLCPI